MNTDFLLQKIIHQESGREVDLSCRIASTYIETMALDGPKLLLTFDDKDSYLRDFLKVKELDTFTVSLSDAWGTGGMDITMPFTILTAPDNTGKTMKYSLMASPVHALKIPADKARMFNRKDAGGILSALLPGAKRNLDGFPVVESYHRLIGERSSKMLRQMALEQGAEIWFARGTIHCKTMKSLMSAPPAFEYHYNRLDQRYRISSYAKLSRQTGMQESVIRKYSGWSDITGRIHAPSGGTAPVRTGNVPTSMMHTQNAATLRNQPTAHIVVVDFLCPGNGHLTPGMVLKTVWNQTAPERPLDESLPDTIVIHTVAHFEQDVEYLCRVRGAVALEPA